MHTDKNYLKAVLKHIEYFLDQKLKLYLHPDKVFVKTLGSGVDFLGWVHFPEHRVFRTATKRRMLANIKINQTSQVIDSYLGILKHGNTKQLQAQIEISKNISKSFTTTL